MEASGLGTGFHAKALIEFGTRLRLTRIAAKIDIPTMCKELGVSYQVYHSWEAGKRAPHDIEIAVKIRALTGMCVYSTIANIIETALREESDR